MTECRTRPVGSRPWPTLLLQRLGYRVGAGTVVVPAPARPDRQAMLVLRTGQAPSGRMTVDGRVVAVRVTESERWGTQYGMVVRLRNGAAVYSTIPRRLEEALGWEPIEALRGRRVRFTATFEQSDRDPHFSFARRPREAALLPPTGT